MVYRSLNGLVPEYLSSKFTKRNVTDYSVRDSENKLVVPFPRTTSKIVLVTVMQPSGTAYPESNLLKKSKSA